MRRKLTEGGYPASICNEVLSFLKEYHYIDDSAYALRYIENYKEQKSQKKLYYDLLKKGIMKDLIDSILEEQPCEEEQQIVRWLEKKRIDPANMDKKECQKAMQALARKGFSWDRIRGVFHL